MGESTVNESSGWSPVLGIAKDVDLTPVISLHKAPHAQHEPALDVMQ